MKPFVILILSCLSALGQPVLTTGSGIDWYAGLPAASSIDFATNQGNARFYWNWQDLTNGITVSNQWSDRIQGVHMWQMDTSKSPTNSAANGVRFNGTQYLTNTGNFAWGVGTSLTGTVFVVFTFENPAQFPCIAASDTSGAFANYVDNSSKLNYFGQIVSSALPSDSFIDVVFLQNGSSSVSVYTNGDFSQTRTISGGTMGQSVLGTSGGDILKGYIAIELCYSNIIDLTAISNLHWWRTNLTAPGLGLIGPLAIQSQPAGVIQIAGQNSTMSVTAGGVVSYQWRRSGSNIGGATSSALSFSPLALSDSDVFDCVLTGVHGDTLTTSVTSNIVVTTTTVSNWVATVTTNGGVCPSITTASTIDTFWNGLVTDGIDSKMLVINCLVPDNLTAAITPLIKGAGSSPWVNHSFVSGDLTLNGLKGNTSTKYLDTGFNQTSFTANDSGIAHYYYSTNTLGTVIDDGAQNFPNGYILEIEDVTVNGANYNQTVGGGFTVATITSATPGFTSLQRTGSSASAIYFANSGTAHTALTTTATGGGTLQSLNMYVFALNNGGSVFGNSDCGLSFLAYTKGLNSSQDSNLYSRVQTMRVSLNGGYH